MQDVSARLAMGCGIRSCSGRTRRQSAFVHFELDPLTSLNQTHLNVNPNPDSPKLGQVGGSDQGPTPLYYYVNPGFGLLEFMCTWGQHLRVWIPDPLELEFVNFLGDEQSAHLMEKGLNLTS